MRPPKFALLSEITLVIGRLYQKLEGREFVAKGVVHTGAVVEDEVLHELAVEHINIKEQVLVEVYKLFLQGAVEPLHVCVHLWSTRVGVVVRQMQLQQSFRKVLLELRAVVGEHECKRKRKHLLAVPFDHPSLASNLLREYPQSAHVGNQSSDGFGFGTTQFVCFAELQEERIRFVFTKVGMFVAQVPEFFQYPVVPQTPTFCLRCTATRIESPQLPVSFLEPPLPAVECTDFYSIRLFGRFRTVLLPKCQYLRSVLCRFGDHIPKAYRSVPCAQKALGASKSVELPHVPCLPRSAIC